METLTIPTIRQLISNIPDHYGERRAIWQTVLCLSDDLLTDFIKDNIDLAKPNFLDDIEELKQFANLFSSDSNTITLTHKIEKIFLKVVSSVMPDRLSRLSQRYLSKYYDVQNLPEPSKWSATHPNFSMIMSKFGEMDTPLQDYLAPIGMYLAKFYKDRYLFVTSAGKRYYVYDAETSVHNPATKFAIHKMVAKCEILQKMLTTMEDKIYNINGLYHTTTAAKCGHVDQSHLSIVNNIAKAISDPMRIRYIVKYIDEINYDNITLDELKQEELSIISGILNMITMEIRPRRHSDYCTKLSEISVIPLIECESAASFLRNVTNNDTVLYDTLISEAAKMFLTQPAKDVLYQTNPTEFVSFIFGELVKDRPKFTSLNFSYLSKKGIDFCNQVIVLIIYGVKTILSPQITDMTSLRSNAAIVQSLENIAMTDIFEIFVKECCTFGNRRKNKTTILDLHTLFNKWYFSRDNRYGTEIAGKFYNHFQTYYIDHHRKTGQDPEAGKCYIDKSTSRGQRDTLHGLLVDISASKSETLDVPYPKPKDNISKVMDMLKFDILVMLDKPNCRADIEKTIEYYVSMIQN